MYPRATTRCRQPWSPPQTAAEATLDRLVRHTARIQALLGTVRSLQLKCIAEARLLKLVAPRAPVRTTPVNDVGERRGTQATTERARARAVAKGNGQSATDTGRRTMGIGQRATRKEQCR